ncbi:MAG: ATP synthase F1 subunit gamma [Bryobacteraceae bacterium]|nr:ATP synthase F1 subunit gamma [Bryobacterales bacterium]MEB2363723.1 ATP synthase F1 subunit gamma [Bryobacterales bacterium]NUN03448.1 ATP synthase F1 subunit gamma [Bryobacteraceae bacterium]
MPSLIDIRRRIRSVRNTEQITKAMKMVSAAKLRRAQDRVISARPYAASLRKLLQDVAGAVVGGAEDTPKHPLLSRRAEQRIQLVLLTGDRGLAGAFNSNLIKASQSFLAERETLQVELLLLGRKGRDFWRRRTVPITDEYPGIFNKVLYEDAGQIAARLAERFANDEIDAVYLLYNEFKSVIAQNLTLLKILPVEIPERENPIDYIYEQPPEELLKALLPRYVHIAVYQAMLESSAAEHAARMTAMDAASSNAAEVIENLTLYMNRVRQASITREIIEIVSGAAALE